jgi:hypothetical protein
VLFSFYCDESYDGKSNPDTYTISGFFSDQPTWKEVEEQWSEINRRYGISCLHASALNCRDKEYGGWCKEKADRYSSELLNAVNRQGKRMRAYNCGMRADEYRAIISDSGRIKLGHPWIVCFQSCIAMIAKDMETLHMDDKLAVVVERGSEFDARAVKMFRELRENPDFAYRYRLADCTLASPDMFVGLQVADLMAYEYFKRLNEKKKMREPLRLIREHNAYVEGFFGRETFMRFQEGIEASSCGPDKLVIIPSL